MEGRGSMERESRQVLEGPVHHCTQCGFFLTEIRSHWKKLWGRIRQMFHAEENSKN